MTVSLHAATVPTWLQVIAAMRSLIDKADEWCAANGHEEAAVLNASLAEGMWPLSMQINSVWMHSAHALAAAQSGVFEPDFSEAPDSLEACRTKLDTARDQILGMDPNALDTLAESTVAFVFGGKVRMRFTAQNFLLSFSNPNFFFHAATAYDILRMKGLDIGKRDYLGSPQIIG